MTCHEFEAHVAAYAAGTLTSTDARTLERHASECDACCITLDRSTRRSDLVFAPPLPASLRGATLRAVGSARTRRGSTRWIGAGLALAAAALLAIWVASGTPTVPATVAVAVADSAPAVATDPGALAADRAVSEFHAIDAAARELQSALDAAPADAELQAFLASVTAQRAELLRRVRDAKT